MQPVSLDTVRTEPLRDLLAWYKSVSANGEWPPLSAFNIANLPRSSWPNVARVDVFTKPFRVFYRAAGEYLCDARGFNFSRKYLDELAIPQQRDLTQWYKYALTIKKPFLSAGYQTVGGVRFYYESCCFPIGSTQDEPRAFILAEAADEIDYWRDAVRKRRYDYVADLTKQHQTA